MEKKRTNYGLGVKYPAEYETWKSIKKRCYNPNNRNFKYYGGKGISVCERWIESFENFFTDMGQRPSLKHSIDRYPNNDGNYEPGNCRWATKEEQSNNRRNVIGINKSRASKNLGLSKTAVTYRLKRGWSLNDATSIPNQRVRKQKS